MARGRILDKRISLSQKLAVLWDEDKDAALFWTWLLPHLDDYGRQEAVPVVLKATVCPLVATITFQDVARILKELRHRELVTIYQPKGSQSWFLEVRNFEQFQAFSRGREGCFPDENGDVPRITRAKRVDNTGAQRSSAKTSRSPASEGRKEGMKTDFLPNPSSSSNASPGGGPPKPLRAGEPPWEVGLDPRSYPDKVTRYEPGRVIKLPTSEMLGNRQINDEATVGQFGGYGNRELGVWCWDGWGKLAHADQVWVPAVAEVEP